MLLVPSDRRHALQLPSRQTGANRERCAAVAADGFIALPASVVGLAVAGAAQAFTIEQITDNSLNDTGPAISGSNVVWVGWDGNDWEIYKTTIPEPSAALLVMTGLLGLMHVLVVEGAKYNIKVERHRSDRQDAHHRESARPGVGRTRSGLRLANGGLPRLGAVRAHS